MNLMNLLAPWLSGEFRKMPADYNNPSFMREDGQWWKFERNLDYISLGLYGEECLRLHVGDALVESCRSGKSEAQDLEKTLELEPLIAGYLQDFVGKHSSLFEMSSQLLSSLWTARLKKDPAFLLEQLQVAGMGDPQDLPRLRLKGSFPYAWIEPAQGGAPIIRFGVMPAERCSCGSLQIVEDQVLLTLHNGKWDRGTWGRRRDFNVSASPELAACLGKIHESWSASFDGLFLPPEMRSGLAVDSTTRLH